MIFSFEQSLGEMSEKDRAALEASGMMASFTSVFGHINPEDKDVVLRHFNDLVVILNIGDSS